MVRQENGMWGDALCGLQCVGVGVSGVCAEWGLRCLGSIQRLLNVGVAVCRGCAVR